MKINGIIIKDAKENVFFAYVKQFPGICAQAGSIEEAQKKINEYFKAFIEKMSHENVEMDTNNIETV
jgi:predicted RNase H-like HicB family nuclease